MDKKMIYYFGDSNTAGIGDTDSPKPDIWYHIPYSKYLTDLLGIESKNLAVPGQNFVLNVTNLVENLHEIEQNASIVIFQTQFLCNTILKYDDKNLRIKDVILTSPHLDKDTIYENKYLGITKEDTVTLLNWTTKFEERRSLYELDIILSIFKYLKTKGIYCYFLYWTPTFDVELPTNEFVLKFKNSNYAMNGTDRVPITFIEKTNGYWKDYHTVNEWNAYLAKEIYKIISK